MEPSYSQLLKINQDYRRNATNQSAEISVLSNIIINQINPFLEYELHQANINALVSSGNYDNILQDSMQSGASQIVLVFWETANIIDGLQYKSNVLTTVQTDEIITKVKVEIDLVFGNLQKNKLVIINRFSTLLFNQYYVKKNNFDKICDELNLYLEQKKIPNTVLVDLDKVIAKVSVDKAVDFRNYYSSKALYTPDFYRAYAKHIAPIVLSVFGKSKKALIFDCDNTLWGGILGEDGESGIHMSASDKKGIFFEEVQFIAKQLATRGIIIGLNSKNNIEDVDQVIQNHPDISIKESDIVIKKINWNDKVANLKEISEQLNIGRDSIVFVDDSDFEINLICKYLPEIITVQVPSTLSDYPSAIRKIVDRFYNLTETDDDLKRVKSYQTESLRKESQSGFSDIKAYLNSLDLQLLISIDKMAAVNRMAQLTQKTNQFNLTTKRYTAAEVESFVNEPNWMTLCFEVKDRFGDFGITGCSFVKMSGTEAIIDTLLMSCRVLGRNIEIKFLHEIVSQLAARGIKTIHAQYIATNKNQQVQNFFDKNGFVVDSDIEHKKTYTLQANGYEIKKINYINVKYERAN